MAQSKKSKRQTSIAKKVVKQGRQTLTKIRKAGGVSSPGGRKIIGGIRHGMRRAGRIK